MKTTDYSITPVYQTDNNGVFSNTIKTYQVTNALQVTLKDTNTTGQVIDTAVLLQEQTRSTPSSSCFPMNRPGAPEPGTL